MICVPAKYCSMSLVTIITPIVSICANHFAKKLKTMQNTPSSDGISTYAVHHDYNIGLLRYAYCEIA